MNTYTFTLMVTGVEEEKLDDLYEATDGAATADFGSAWANRVDFDWEASSLADAVLSAIDNVETVAGLTVLRVEPDELVWASEIAERTSRSRQSVDQLIKGQRGAGGFPPPLTGSTRNPLWRWTEVEGWFATHEGRDPDLDRSTVIGAVNGTLEARRNLQRRNDPDLVKKLEELLVS